MVKVIIPRKYGLYKGVLQIDNTHRLLIFRNNPFRYHNPQHYLDSFLYYSCLDNRIELLDWLLCYDPEIETNLTKILSYFLKTRRSIAVNQRKIDYKWISELLNNVEEEVVEEIEITNKTSTIWKLKDCTT